MRRMTWLAAGLAGALALGGCLNSADTKKMDDATAQLFAQMKAGQFEAIYAAGAPELTGTTPKDAFVAFMQQAASSYGACQTPVKAMSFHVNATTGGYFSEQGYTAQCANGPMQLQVTMVLRGGVAKLAGIHVGPEATTSSSPASNTADNAASNGT